VRSTGRVAQLGQLVTANSLAGTIGIAHTRWATHGAPSEANAHPHVSGGISVVHNGIIENHEEMRSRLKARGYAFLSETDSEVIAHLVHSFRAEGLGLLAAVRKAVAQLRGAYAIAVIAEEDPTRMVVARMGAPLLLGLGENEYFAASDTSALLPVTQKIIFLEEGDCAEMSLDGLRIVEARGRAIERPWHQSTLTAEAVELGSYSHYMQKEIFEQPRAIADTLELATKTSELSPHLFGAEAPRVLDAVDSVLVVACGTSYHAGWSRSNGSSRSPASAATWRSRANTATANRCPIRARSWWPSPNRARPPTRSRRSSTRAASASRTASRSATSRNRRWCGRPSFASSRARARRSASPRPRPSPPSSPRCCCSR
jgi:glucosamine--fructose-6-phosphate aminotransferase (isomerizing)